MIKKIKNFFYGLYQFYLYANFTIGLVLYTSYTGDNAPLTNYGNMVAENGVVPFISKEK